MSLSNLIMSGKEYEPEITHHFSDGVCIREMKVIAGAVIVGAEHKTNHLNILSEGIMQLSINGESRVIKAPYTFESLAGSRKLGFAYTPCTFSNIFPTELTNIEDIEDMFTTYREDKARIDFGKFIANNNLSLEWVDKLSFDSSTYTPVYSNVYKIQDSIINGNGLFTTHNILAGDCLGRASIGGTRTELGRFVNHSDKPNIKFTNDTVTALVDIPSGTELTVDYNNNFKQIKELL